MIYYYKFHGFALWRLQKEENHWNWRLQWPRHAILPNADRITTSAPDYTSA
jgi:hypothetical protein